VGLEKDQETILVEPPSLGGGPRAPSTKQRGFEGGKNSLLLSIEK
jgi:hypothetical protein